MSRLGPYGGPPARTRSQGLSSSAVAESSNYAAAAQELASVVNNPAAAQSSWLAWPFSAGAVDFEAAPPPLPPGTLPEVSIEDFAPYLRTVGSKLDEFERDRAASEHRLEQALTPEELAASQGQGLVAALAEVPQEFFQENIDADRSMLWSALGDVTSEEPRQEALDRLSHFLDVVESHLVREIAARTDNFFDASGYVQDVQGAVYRLYCQVAEMRGRISKLEVETAGQVQVSQQLQRRRTNLATTLEVLSAMEGIAQAQQALQGLLPQAGGVGVDYAGAIDVLEVLQGVLDNQDILSLDCFRSLPQQIADTAQAVDDLMIGDFLERTRFGGAGLVAGRVLGRLADQLKGSAALEEESLAAVVGAKLADAASADTVTAWAEGGAEVGEDSLHDVLLPLVIGMRRMGRLSAALATFREVAVAGMHEAIKAMVESCLEVLAPELAGADTQHLLAGVQPSQNGAGNSRLALLPGDHFQWVLQAVLLTVKAHMNHTAWVTRAVQSVLGTAHATQQQISSAAQEAKACSQALAEAAVNRWSKLLAARAHKGRPATVARLSELQDIMDTSSVLMAEVEGHGVRSLLGLRNALQQICRLTLDAMHARAINKLATLLEQEQWAAALVAPHFQRLVDGLQARAQALQGSADAAVPLRVANGGSSNPAPISRKFTITPPEVGGADEGASPTLAVAGQQYHVAHTQLVLLETLLAEYLAFKDAVPAMSGEVAQRVLESLKIFNSRTCQLVLGAGAMQVSGLKSITAKHLAISFQCLGAAIALHPTLALIFSQGVPSPRQEMLAADFERTLQDFIIHQNEISSKLVAIMRERLSANIKLLPTVAATWPTGPAHAARPAPSSFAATSAKQLQILSGVLSPLLLPSELHSIFGRVGLMFSRTLAEAYALIEPRGGAWQQQLQADVDCMLGTLSALPLDPAQREDTLEALAAFRSSLDSGAARDRPPPPIQPAPGLPAVPPTAMPPADTTAAASAQQQQQQEEEEEVAAPSGDPAPEAAAPVGDPLSPLHDPPPLPAPHAAPLEAALAAEAGRSSSNQTE